MKPSAFLTLAEKESILAAIREAESLSSGEIRVHLEKNCPEDEVLDRAAYLFEKLKMHRTALRTGVLFYVSVDDRKLAILGDAGINAVTPDDFWEQIRLKIINHFSDGRYAEGLVEGIRMAGNALKDYFPYRKNDNNELSDEISTGNF